MDAVVDHSRQTIERGSRSFAAAARLFDAETRASAYMLYAWCRHCDDVIDGQCLGHGPVAHGKGREDRLRGLAERTRAALSGSPPPEPAFQALARVVERHAIPPRYPLELLDGFAMDVGGRRYPELEDTLLYCYHVAGVVGVMMAHVMGVREEETLARAADLGIALQLTNIARDVTEDAAAGRCYLPERWLAEAGVPLTEVLDPGQRPRVAAVVRRLLEEAERYYDSARGGLPRLGLRAAWAVATARGVYRDIGTLVLRRGERAWDTRVVVGRPRKLVRALGGGLVALRACTVDRLVEPPPRGPLWTKPEPSPKFPR